MNVQLKLILARRRCVMTQLHASSLRWIALGSTGTEAGVCAARGTGVSVRRRRSLRHPVAGDKFTHTFGRARRCGDTQR
jgi:hypothetical protein